MGMSTFVYGIKPPDERWQQMRAVYDACWTAGVEPPREVGEFFAGEPPDSAGVVLLLSDTVAVTDWVDPDPRRAREGVEVHLDQISPDIKVIRFVNSW
jgi:hypothetical protein